MKERVVHIPDAGEDCLTFTHKSGLRVFLTKKELRASYAVIGVRFGSFSEKCLADGEEVILPDGTAHFLEHKMFENEDGEDTFLKFSRTGASANAYTGYDQTCYLFSTKSAPEESLEILLQSVFSPCFTDANVKKEKGIILEELKMYADDPIEGVTRAVNRRMYRGHRLTRDIVGTMGSVRAITKEDLYKAYDLFYRPSNMVLSLCGRFDAERVRAQLDALVPDDRRPAPVVKPLAPERLPDECPRRRSVVYKDIPLPMAVIGLKCPKSDPVGGTEAHLRVYHAMSILASRLFSAAYPYVSELQASGLLTLDPTYEVVHGASYSRILFYAYTTDPARVLGLFDKHVKELLSRGLSAEDLLRGKKMLWAEFLDGFNSSEGTATRYLSDALENLKTEKTGECIFGLTEEEIARTAREILSPRRICACAFYPSDQKKGEKK